MFHSVTIRGGAAELLWGHHVAAAVRGWKIKKHDGQWMLIARTARIDAYNIRQRGLIFAGARTGGFWCCPVLSLDIGPDYLVARLGPPEQ